MGQAWLRGRHMCFRRPVGAAATRIIFTIRTRISDSVGEEACGGAGFTLVTHFGVATDMGTVTAGDMDFMAEALAAATTARI